MVSLVHFPGKLISCVFCLWTALDQEGRVGNRYQHESAGTRTVGCPGCLWEGVQGGFSMLSGAKFWECGTSPSDCPQPKGHQPGHEPTEQVPDLRGGALVWSTEVWSVMLSAVATKHLSRTFHQLSVNLDRPGKRDSQLTHCFHQIAPWACLWALLSLLIDS